MSTQATIKRVRKETGKTRTLTRRDIARIRKDERAQGERAFAALLASRAGSQTSGAY